MCAAASASGEAPVAEHLALGAVALLVLAYLFHALLAPERF